MKTKNAEKKFVDRLERSEKTDGNEIVYNGIWMIMNKYVILVQYT